MKYLVVTKLVRVDSSLVRGMQRITNSGTILPQSPSLYLVPTNNN